MNTEQSHSFHVLNILTTAWSKVYGVKGPLWFTWLVMVAITLVITILIGGMHMVLPQQGVTVHTAYLLGVMPGKAFIIELINIFVTIPLMTGVLMIAIKHARGQKVSPRDGFCYYRWHYWWKLFIVTLILFVVSFIIALLVNSIPLLDTLGNPASSMMESLLAALIMAIVLIVAFIIYLATIFVVPAIADQDSSILGAFKLSLKLAVTHWFRIILLIISVLIITAILAIPFILAMLTGSAPVILLAIFLEFIIAVWALPYLYMIYAETYVRLANSLVA